MQVMVPDGQGMAFAHGGFGVYPAQLQACVAGIDQYDHGAYSWRGRTDTSPMDIDCSPCGVRSSNWPRRFMPQAMPACAMRPSSSTLMCWPARESTLA